MLLYVCLATTLSSILFAMFAERFYCLFKGERFAKARISHGKDNALNIDFARVDGVTTAAVDGTTVFSASSFGQTVSKAEFNARNDGQYKVVIKYNPYFGICSVCIDGFVVSSWVFRKPLRIIVMAGHLLPAAGIMAMLIVGLWSGLRVAVPH